MTINKILLHVLTLWLSVIRIYNTERDGVAASGRQTVSIMQFEKRKKNASPRKCEFTCDFSLQK